MEYVMRQIIDASCGEGNADLIITESPGFLLLGYFQQEKPLLDALNDIAILIQSVVEFSTPAPDFRPTFTLVRGVPVPR